MGGAGDAAGQANDDDESSSVEMDEILNLNVDVTNEDVSGAYYSSSILRKASQQQQRNARMNQSLLSTIQRRFRGSAVSLDQVSRESSSSPLNRRRRPKEPEKPTSH